MRRAVKRTLLSVGLASLVTTGLTAATVAPSWATPPQNLVQTLLPPRHRHVARHHPAQARK